MLEMGMGRPWLAAAAASLASMLLSACSTAGPTSIGQGRMPYNEVIQNTSEQQTLLNLVRVHDAETPLFMDVTEVDAATTITGSITGGASGIGAAPNRGTSSAGTIAGVVGAITGTAQYQEAPTVRYQPLLGSALVSQVSTPINADSLASLYNSGWGIGAILDLTAVRLTPGFDQYHAAVNAIMELDRYGALIIAANSEKDTSQYRAKSNILNVSITETQGSKDNDSLYIYYQKGSLRSRFRTCDENQAVIRGQVSKAVQDQVDHDGGVLWARLQHILGQSSNPIVLRVKPGSDAGNGRLAGASRRADERPQLRTKSALGVMKSAAEGDNLISFGSEAQINAIIDGQTSNLNCNSYFWQTARGERYSNNNARFSDLPPGKSILDVADFERERHFSEDRRLILVEVTRQPPAGAFVSVFHEGLWYSIQSRDMISKLNLALVAQINTIQAVAPSGGALTPTIAVGAR